MNNKILMVVNEDRFFLSHRKDIALEAQLQGYDIAIVCKDTGRKQEITDMGIPVIELPINPTVKESWQILMEEECGRNIENLQHNSFRDE